MTMAPSYPTSHQIEEMFEEGDNNPEGFLKYVDPKVKVTVCGHDHHLAGEFVGIDSLKNDHFAEFCEDYGFLQESQARGCSGHWWWRSGVGVCGGESNGRDSIRYGSPCCSSTIFIPIHSEGDFDWYLFAEGKKWIHECVYVVRFNTESRITKLRAYHDSAHIHDHVETRTTNTAAA